MDRSRAEQAPAGGDGGGAQAAGAGEPWAVAAHADRRGDQGGDQGRRLRPAALTEDDAKAIVLHRLSLGDKLFEISHTTGMPSVGRVQRWRREDADFDAAVRAAYELRAHLYAEEALAIADTAGEVGEVAFVNDGEGNVRETRSVRIDTAKLRQDEMRINARQWIASRWLPSVYGARSTHEHVGDGGGPVQLIIGALREDL